MIGQALDCVADDINAHLQRAQSDNIERVLLSNVVDEDGHTPTDAADKVVLTLVSLDEEKNILEPGGVSRGATSVRRSTDQIYLNVHVMFAATHRHYRTGLDALSSVIAYLKSKPTFDHRNTPQLPDDVRRLNFNLEKLSYADGSNIWSYLGANYLPSVVYTIRMVALGSPQLQSVDPAVETVGVGS